MKLQRREKILAAILGGLLLLTAVWYLLFSGGSRSYSQLEAARQSLIDDVSKKEARVKMAAVAARQITEWQRRALPSDTAHARSLYQSWLLQLADRLEFRQLKVDSSGTASPRRNAPTLFTFTLHGRASLPKLVEFFHEFYSAGHLHQIRHVDVKPAEKSPDLEVNVTVEAMSLQGADRKDQLTKEPGKSLKLAKLSDYTKMLVGRNVFGAMPLPGPGNMPKPPDMAQTTFVTGIVAVDGRGEVWLVDRSSGKDWKLHEGEPVQIGSLQGSVKTIGMEEVTIDSGGRLRTYKKGDNLRGAEETPGTMKMPSMVMPPGKSSNGQKLPGAERPSDATMSPQPMMVPPRNIAPGTTVRPE